ncbi:MAG: pyruvate kinase [Spirochaetaceae bacterium]|nr:MAG: pyruvate kinase [Spirochaetaceae bacterium]
MSERRKTRIVCTLGPAVDSVEQVKALLHAGMNVARFNFSHGNHAEHADRLQRLRGAARESGIPVATMLDTKGPEIRTGTLRGSREITVNVDDQITLTTEEIEGDSERLSVSYKQLPAEVEPGKRIYIADGLIELEVVSIEGSETHCVVRHGGTFGSRKNVNIPGVRVSLPAITDKDREDIVFAVQNGFDFIAASFIRKPEDVVQIQETVQQYESPIMVISKIEDQEGLDNIDAIIRVSAGVMVARGDLGVQLPTERIPLAQKRIIQKCNAENKPVITATQMLDSMIHNPNPTRAELTDVANAIFDGTDAVMLSGETAAGRYPVRSVETMHRIAMSVEQSPEYRQRCRQYFALERSAADIGHAVAKAAYVVAEQIDAAVIVTPTLRGNTPRILSRFRPLQNIIAVTTSETTSRQLLLSWGVFPVLSEHVRDSELMLQNALKMAMKQDFVKRFDRVVTATGVPLNSPIPLNTIKVHFLGSILNRGHRGFGAAAAGKITRADSAADAEARLKQDGTEILLTRRIGTEHSRLIASLRGVILEENSSLSKEQLLELNPQLVFIAEVPDALDQFEHGQFVSLDGEEKIIYEGSLEQ